MSDSWITTFICLYEAVAALEEISVDVINVPGGKPTASYNTYLASHLAEKISRTLLEHTTYAEKFNSRNKRNQGNYSSRGLRPNRSTHWKYRSQNERQESDLDDRDPQYGKSQRAKTIFKATRKPKWVSIRDLLLSEQDPNPILDEGYPTSTGRI